MTPRSNTSGTQFESSIELREPSVYFQNAPILATSDPERIEQVVSDVIAPHKLRGNFSRSSLASKFNAMDLGDVTVGYLAYGAQVALEIPEDSLVDYHINIPVSGRAHTMFRNGLVKADPSMGAFYNPGHSAKVDIDENCSQICIKYSTQALMRELEQLLNRPIRQPLEFQRAVDVATPAGSRWLHTIKLVDQSAELIDHPILARRLERLLVDSLLFGQLHSYSRELDMLTETAGRRHPKAVQQVIDFVMSDPMAVVGVSDMAQIAGLSVRALQLAFKQNLGVTPMTFLRDTRLDRAREQLLTTPSGTVTVTRVAHDWGFINPGRFSAQYFERFGEMPSETLRNGPR